MRGDLDMEYAKWVQEFWDKGDNASIGYCRTKQVGPLDMVGEKIPSGSEILKWRMDLLKKAYGQGMPFVVINLYARKMNTESKCIYPVMKKTW